MNAKLNKKQMFFHILIVAISVAAFLALVYLILRLTGLWENFRSVERARKFILSMGIYGRIVFLVLQFLQVTFIPIPAIVLILAGSLIYGPMQASLLSFAGILLGSAFAFFLGKCFGRKLVTFMVGDETRRKWVKFLNNGKYSYVIMMLLPFFPDDILCLVAGLTDMSWQYFIVTQVLTRPVGILTTAYLSSGQIIPYHGWGLVAWGVIVIVTILLIFLTSKYSNKIELFFSKIFSKNKIKNK